MPSPSVVADGALSDRMIRRIDLLFALLVCVIGFAAYLGFPYLKRPAPEMARTTPATLAPRVPARVAPLAPLESARLRAPLDPSAPRSSEVDAWTPPESPHALLSASPKLDVVPPRTPVARAKPDAVARRPVESAPPAPSRRSYAVTTSFGVESFGPPPAAAPARTVAPTPRAPARVDQLQQMNDALESCAGQGLFARVACEQRAFLAYCDGRWGQNERCPSGRTTDYGN